MLPFAAPTIMKALTNLEWTADALARLLYAGGDHKTPEHVDAVKTLAGAVNEVEEATIELPMSELLKTSLERLKDVAGDTDADHVKFHQPQVMAREFQKNLIVEMGAHIFFMVPATDVQLYVAPTVWFESGKPVLRKFPKARRDIVDAGKCCALGQWSAVAFHSMCVLDHGLVAMVRAVGAAVPSRGDWNRLISVIEEKITDLRNQNPRSAKANQVIDRYSEAATQLRHVKDAWRNHTMHGRKVYEEVEARHVLNTVKYFMRSLS
jgi:hypothetical protein